MIYWSDTGRLQCTSRIRKHSWLKCLVNQVLYLNRSPFLVCLFACIQCDLVLYNLYPPDRLRTSKMARITSAAIASRPASGLRSSCRQVSRFWARESSYSSDSPCCVVWFVQSVPSSAPLCSQGRQGRIQGRLFGRCNGTRDGQDLLWSRTRSISHLCGQVDRCCHPACLSHSRHSAVTGLSHCPEHSGHHQTPLWPCWELLNCWFWCIFLWMRLGRYYSSWAEAYPTANEDCWRNNSDRSQPRRWFLKSLCPWSPLRSHQVSRSAPREETSWAWTGFEVDPILAESSSETFRWRSPFLSQGRWAWS